MKLIERIETTQIELLTTELSLNGQNKKLHEELTTLKSDLTKCTLKHRQKP
jgi:hypothetical protein